MGEFNSDDHYIYYCGQESLRRNREALIVNKRVRNAVFGCSFILAWKIPWTEEPGGLQSMGLQKSQWTGRPGVLRFMGSQRVGHDRATGRMAVKNVAF